MSAYVVRMCSAVAVALVLGWSAPMISGAAAILKGAYPGRSPFEIKSVLMNTAETNIVTNPMTTGTALAPTSGNLRMNTSQPPTRP